MNKLKMSLFLIRTDQEAVLCQMVQQNYSNVDDNCIVTSLLQRAGLSGVDFTVDGIANFQLPEIAPAWINSVSTRYIFMMHKCVIIKQLLIPGQVTLRFLLGKKDFFGG